MSRSERIAVALTAAVSLALRAVAFFRYRFDSDEPQHLHVAWGWTAGLVQYRDIFDNHTPLFHMITAPLLAAVGERPDILFFMRAAMLPLFAVVVAGTYVLASRLYSTRVAVWSALVLSLFPTFFLKSLEYRSDNLWNAIWIVSLLILMSGPPTAGRMFVSGLLLGCAFAVSIKTVLLLIALVGAAIITRFIRPSLKATAAAVAGFVIVPTALAAYFVAAGAWSDLVYCVWEFNRGVAATRPQAWTLRALTFPFAIGAVVFLTRRNRHRDPRALFLSAFTGVYIATLVAFWPLISPRDLLPVLPLIAIFGVAAMPWPALAAGAVLLTFFVAYYADFFRNGTRIFTTALDQGLRLSRPGEPVMDHKGETIFRRRPYFFALETVTRQSLRSGLIADTIPEDVVKARCFVAQADGPFLPPRGRRFLSENFMDMGRYRAAGQWIKPDGSFTIAVAGPYVILNEGGEAGGLLDGQPYAGRRDLAAGSHRFERAVSGQSVAVLWAPAFERGFSPFHLKDREF